MDVSRHCALAVVRRTAWVFFFSWMRPKHCDRWWQCCRRSFCAYWRFSQGQKRFILCAWLFSCICRTTCLIIPWPPIFKLPHAKFMGIIITIYSLTVRIVGAPQMISQPVSSIFPSSPLPSVTLLTPGLSIPWCCLPTSSSVCLVFFSVSLCFARWFWPDLMNGRHDHTTAVCVSLQWSGGLRVVWLRAGSWHRLPLGYSNELIF